MRATLNRHRELFLPPINLDRSSRVPLQRQIYRDLGRAIRTGAIRHGAKLPASRQLAEMLGVSRNTVLAAYDSLAADHLICGERGSGMRVNGTPRPTLTFSWFADMLRVARYPRRVVPLTDPDGNWLYLNF